MNTCNHLTKNVKQKYRSMKISPKKMHFYTQKIIIEKKKISWLSLLLTGKC